MNVQTSDILLTLEYAIQEGAVPIRVGSALNGKNVVFLA